MNAPLLKGIIKRFNNNAGKNGGYGFIVMADGSDMFVHITELRGASAGDRQLFPGDQVSFEIGQNQRGQSCAKNVRVQLRAAFENQPPPRYHKD